MGQKQCNSGTQAHKHRGGKDCCGLQNVGACSCDHDHCVEHSDCGCGKEHDQSDGLRLSWQMLLPLLVGGGLLAAGAFLSGILQTCVWMLAYLIVGGEILIGAVRGFAKGRFFDEQVLMSVATIGTICLGDYAEAVAVMLFYRVGEGLQEMAVARSRQRINETVELHPDKARRIENGIQSVVAPDEIAVGEQILVKVGERVPLDGVVAEGDSLLDVSMLTGEPKPERVKAGSMVLAGSVNTTGQLIVRVRIPASESSTSRLLRAVEDAAKNKPELERFITRFSRIYTPCMIGAAALVAVIPPLLGLGAWSLWISRALIFLVISCPCALVLSIPLTFFCGLAIASKNSVLCKGADALEQLVRVKAVVMDKTGTLSKGEFSVQSVETAGLERDELLALASALEQNSLHPIAFAISSASTRGYLAEKVSEIAGHGITGEVNGHRVAIGNAALMMQQGAAVPERAGVFVAVDGQYVGCIHVGDQLRDSAKKAVNELNDLVGCTVILTGDNVQAAQDVGEALGVTEVYGGLLPEDKLAQLRKIRTRVGNTMFVGDGINDAPVLAGADVGVAMGLGGTEMAAEAADALLLTDDLTRLPFVIRVAKKTVRTAKQNIGIALGIKAAALVLGVLGIANMWVAVVADVGAACICVLHTVTLFQRIKR
ncbi:MAG: heavy metal translocating P-type ATPase [Clostridia bacterium]